MAEGPFVARIRKLEAQIGYIRSWEVVPENLAPSLGRLNQIVRTLSLVNPLDGLFKLLHKILKTCLRPATG